MVMQAMLSRIFTLDDRIAAGESVGGISRRFGNGGAESRLCSCGSRANSDRTGGTGRIPSNGYIIGADGS